MSVGRTVVSMIVTGGELRGNVYSVLLKAQPELVVRGGELHQRLLDPEGGVPDLAVLMPALDHQLPEPRQDLGIK